MLRLNSAYGSLWPWAAGSWPAMGLDVVVCMRRSRWTVMAGHILRAAPPFLVLLALLCATAAGASLPLCNVCTFLS